MADLSNVFAEAGKWVGSAAGGGAIALVAGQLLKGWLSGGTQTDRETRDEQRADLKSLREEMRVTREEVDALREEVRHLNSAYLFMLGSRSDARLTLRSLERNLNRPETVWPPDPSDLLTR